MVGEQEPSQKTDLRRSSEQSELGGRKRHVHRSHTHVRVSHRPLVIINETKTSSLGTHDDPMYRECQEQSTASA